MPRDKSRYRERRSSSYSSESSYDRKKSKSSHRRRSRSRDRSVSSNYKRKRSSSRTRHKRRSYSRSLSRDRYESKSRRRSSSRSKRSKRSYSRDISKSRSPSRSRRHKKSKKSGKKSRSSSSRSNSIEIIEKPIPPKPGYSEDEAKLERAIKAAEAAGLTLTKIPTYEYKEIPVKEDMPTIQDRNLIAELNSDAFVQKSFTSSRSKKQSNIVIDLDAQTVKVPDSEVKAPKNDSILNLDQSCQNVDLGTSQSFREHPHHFRERHKKELPSEEELKEMWIKKLYQYRKKMLRGEI